MGVRKVRTSEHVPYMKLALRIRVEAVARDHVTTKLRACSNTPTPFIYTGVLIHHTGCSLIRAEFLNLWVANPCWIK